jgi:hypothetical protein
MKAAMGNKHQVVIKIIKQLDESMVRDPYEEEVNEEEEQEDLCEVPVPSCSLIEMGVSVSGFEP